jgi:hypothetical protein
VSDHSSLEKMESRISALEESNRSLEKRLYAALAVAGVLGLSGVLGGTWLQNTANRLVDLTTRTKNLETNLNDWDKTVETSVTHLTSETDKLKQDIDSTEKTAEARLSSSEAVLQLAALQDGKASLRVSKIELINSKNKTVVELGADANGGYATISDSTGNARFSQYIDSGKMPNEYISGTKGDIWLGTFTNGLPGMAFENPSNSREIQFSIGDKGGQIILSNSANRIAYFGPDTKSGSGLLAVYGVNGEQTNFFATKTQ